jgi:predicted NBD/HSP70 family sugar kinase
MSDRTRKYVLGLHIGASSRHAAVLDLQGNVLFRNDLHEPPEERCARNYRTLLEDAVQALQGLIREAEASGIGKERIIGGGAVVPAPVDTLHGYVRLAPALRGLQNTYLARDLECGVKEVLRRSAPFWVENDANGAALAEMYFGAARDVTDFVAIMLCTGLGGSLFLDGALRHGHTFMAGEIGHTTVQPDGPLCNCGGRGCLETLVSGAKLLRAARDLGTSLSGRQGLQYADLVGAAEAGDAEIQALFRTMGQYLGIGIANVVNTLNPSKVILTGQLVRAAKFFLPAAEEEMRMRVFSGMDCDLVVSELGDNGEVLSGLSTFRYYSDKEGSDRCRRPRPD